MGIIPTAYYTSEIDKFARKEVAANWPDVVQLGDVTKWCEWDIDWASIDLVIGGSPCQGFSAAGKHGGTKAVYDGVEYLIDSREMFYTTMREYR